MHLDVLIFVGCIHLMYKPTKYEHKLKEQKTPVFE